MEKESRRFWWGLLAIVLLFFSIQNFEAVEAGIGMIMGLILPLLYGCAMAFVLNLIVRILERFLTFGPFKHRLFRRIVCIFLAFIVVVGVLAGIVAGVVPEMESSIRLLGDKLPGVIQWVIDFGVNTLELPHDWFQELQRWDVSAFLNKLLENDIIQNILKSGGSLVSVVVGTVMDLVVGLFFAVYLLIQKEALARNFRRLSKAYLKPPIHERAMHVATCMNEIYSSFISGQCLDALILGAMVTVVLAIFGIHYALLIGIVIAVTALVPIVGAFLGGSVGVFLLLMVSSREALLFLIIFLVLQQVDNQLIYPHVVGSTVGLPAIWIFAAIVVGGNFGGIVGMILAIPMFALVYSLLAQDLRKREKQAEELAEDPEKKTTE